MLLPLLALGLATGSAFWLVGGAGPHASRSERSVGDIDARISLLDARDALLAHATAYPETYGPLGAGPGHLVCPDTDTPLERSPAPSSGGTRDAFRGDGPNPPCGGGSLVIGYLPRHASPDGRRRAFHHEPVQRLVYGVLTGYVNNPPGQAIRRVSSVSVSVSGPGVGTATGVDARTGAGVDIGVDTEAVVDVATDTSTDVVAVILDPRGVSLPRSELTRAGDPREFLQLARATVSREAGAAMARTVPHVFLTREMLIDAARRRVAAWFVDTATVTARRRAETPGPNGTGPASGVSSRWLDAVCPGDAPPASLRWVGDPGMAGGTTGEVTSGDADGDASGDASGGADDGTADDTNDEANDGTAAAEDPEGDCTMPLTIENTPTARHWFVRDGWFEDIALSVHDGCRGESAVACRSVLAHRREARVDVTIATAGAPTPIDVELVPLGPMPFDPVPLDPATLDDAAGDSR